MYIQMWLSARFPHFNLFACISNFDLITNSDFLCVPEKKGKQL